MKYKDLIQFEQIESVVQLLDADRTGAQHHRVGLGAVEDRRRGVAVAHAGVEVDVDGRAEREARLGDGRDRRFATAVRRADRHRAHLAQHYRTRPPAQTWARVVEQVAAEYRRAGA